MTSGNIPKSIVRNVVFESTDIRFKPSDWVEHAFSQIEAAFFWDKLANICSHRVNLCDYIGPNNRKVGLNALRKLFKKVVEK